VCGRLAGHDPDPRDETEQMGQNVVAADGRRKRRQTLVADETPDPRDHEQLADRRQRVRITQQRGAGERAYGGVQRCRKQSDKIERKVGDPLHQRLHRLQRRYLDDKLSLWVQLHYHRVDVGVDAVAAALR